MEKKYRYGSSLTQQRIEGYLFEKIRTELNDSTLIRSRNVVFLENPDVHIAPDFYSEETHVIGEIHTHPGRLKSSQMKKIAADVLKMIALEEDRKTEYRKYIVICSEKEYEQLTGSSLLAWVMQKHRIAVKIYRLTEELQNELETTVLQQDMVRNPDYTR